MALSCAGYLQTLGCTVNTCVSMSHLLEKVMHWHQQSYTPPIDPSRLCPPACSVPARPPHKAAPCFSKPMPSQHTRPSDAVTEERCVSLHRSSITEASTRGHGTAQGHIHVTHKVQHVLGCKTRITRGKICTQKTGPHQNHTIECAGPCTTALQGRNARRVSTCLVECCPCRGASKPQPLKKILRFPTCNTPLEHMPLHPISFWPETQTHCHTLKCVPKRTTGGTRVRTLLPRRLRACM